jgi:formamidopyrimidine-DNA glycosylase
VTARVLASRLEGARLSAWSFSGRALRHPFPGDAMSALEGATLRRVGRRAKYVLMAFDSGCLAIHLGMSGAMRCEDDPPAAPLLHDHVRMVFVDSQGRRLTAVFHDPRRFGSFQWLSDESSGDPGLRLGDSACGIEPLDPAFDGALLHRLSRGVRTPIKPWLMSGRVVVGVGNIYACEALFAAGIHPARRAGQVSRQRYERLAPEIRRVLEAAIAAGGSSISDFIGADGAPGRYGQSHRVYGRSGQPCTTCGAALRRIIQQQRSTFYCHACQR